MKKTLIVISIILLVAVVGFGIFYFFGGGKQTVNNFFGQNDFGTFFDINPQSRNELVGRGDNNNTEPLVPSPEESEYTPPILRQISFEPVAGYTFYSTTSTSTRSSTNLEGSEVLEEFLATSTVVRFQERATGHIYDVFEFIEAPQKVSPVTEQKIYSTQWSNNKNIFIYKKLISNNEYIQTNIGELVFSTSSDVFLKTNNISNIVSDLTLNKETNKLIYSIKQNGFSSIALSNIDRTGEQIIKNLYFTEFTLDIINKDNVLITTNSSQVAPGYAYILNTTSKAFSKILGGVSGLLIKVSPNTRHYIYSGSNIDRPVVSIVDSQTQTSTLLPFDTLPSEKCVFSKKQPTAYCFGSILYKKAQYPDDWYKGKVLNFESLYKIDLTNSSASLVYSLTADELNADVYNVQLSDNEDFITFQNKYDLTLWSIDLERLAN